MGFDEYVAAAMSEGGGTEEGERLKDVLREKEDGFRGLVGAYAKVKGRYLEVVMAQEEARDEIAGMRKEADHAVRSFLEHAREVGSKGHAAGHLRRSLVEENAKLREGLNVLTCCMSITELKRIPIGWRWSHNRSVCGACRQRLKELVRNHCKVRELEGDLARAESQRDDAKRAISELVQTTRQRLGDLPIHIQSFTTRNTTGHYAPGIFFGVSSRERAVVITSLKIGTHPKLGAGEEGAGGKELTVTVYVVNKGVVVNKQLGDTDVVRGIVLDRSKWMIAGTSKVKLPSVSVFDSAPQYAAVNLKHPIELDAGTIRAMCIHTDNDRGVAIRRPAKELERTKGGLLTEADGVLELLAGPASGRHVFSQLSGDASLRTSAPSAALVGCVQYRFMA